MNYTKYRLKDRDELAAVLADADQLFVVACNKCFKEFEAVDEPECEQLTALAAQLGKTVTGTAHIDFLCNAVQTERKLRDAVPEGTEHVVVISCGLGVQTVAGMLDVPVYAASDSLNYTGHHGMALTKRSCDACAQCYLNMTGGICPIVDCSKSLTNGQCGGAKNGKCEVDSSKDCAWEKIYRRLEKQGRLEEFLNQPIQLRDYSKTDHKFISEYVKAIRAERYEGYYGGVHPCERKEFTEHMPLVRYPEPETVVIPLSQHFGAPATALVQPGDTVQVGQKIGELGGSISSAIHSSVSGTVEAVEPRLHPTMGQTLSVVIRSDGKNTLHESVQPNKPLEELTADEIVAILKDKGVVGMGGAGFPTFFKLQPGKPVDTVLINGSECEPILTADHRVLLEYADDVIFGLRTIIKAVGAERGIIVIEDNKADAIEVVQEKAAQFPGIEVLVAKTKYPQGAEKMLIKRATGRKVPRGGLPADAGCVVSNVSTAKAVSDAIQRGMPLVERVVTVSGERMKNPGNFIIKVGTNVSDIIAHCGGVTGGDVTVKLGGPMMGFAQADWNVPVLKGTNGIIAIDTDHTQAVECIKCGRCADVCPMELMPLYFAKYADENNVEGLKAQNIMDCMECRCCEYICSSKIPLVTKIKAGKAAVKAAAKR